MSSSKPWHRRSDSPCQSNQQINKCLPVPATLMLHGLLHCMLVLHLLQLCSPTQLTHCIPAAHAGGLHFTYVMHVSNVCMPHRPAEFPEGSLPGPHVCESVDYNNAIATPACMHTRTSSSPLPLIAGRFKPYTLVYLRSLLDPPIKHAVQSCVQGVSNAVPNGNSPGAAPTSPGATPTSPGAATTSPGASPSATSTADVSLSYGRPMTNTPSAMSV